MVTRAFLLSLMMTSAVACAAADDVGPGSTEIVDADDKADGELRARVDGMTVWVDREARLATRDGQPVWVIEGRASRNLAEVHAWVPDDAFGQAVVVSARKFEVRLAPGHEANTLLSGLAIFVDVVPVSGAQATAAVWVAPRFGGFSGSGEIWLRAGIEPVWVAGELVYRAAASVRAPFEALAVNVAGGTPPLVVSEGGQSFRIDLGYDALAAGTLSFTASANGGGSAEKHASLAASVTRLGLTREDPREAFADGCEAAVLACLEGLAAAGLVDAGSCGAYRAVQRCGGVPVAGAPSPAQLATDLRQALVEWYAAHGEDVAASGGQSLQDAQASVDGEAFEAVVDPEEDPMAHDLGAVMVFRHPDVVWPGSDIVWFLVYDRGSGELVEVYEFN